jgi:hypothetical protein
LLWALASPGSQGAALLCRLLASLGSRGCQQLWAALTLPLASRLWCPWPCFGPCALLLLAAGLLAGSASGAPAALLPFLPAPSPRAASLLLSLPSPSPPSPRPSLLTQLPPLPSPLFLPRFFPRSPHAYPPFLLPSLFPRFLPSPPSLPLLQPPAASPPLWGGSSPPPPSQHALSAAVSSWPARAARGRLSSAASWPAWAAGGPSAAVSSWPARAARGQLSSGSPRRPGGCGPAWALLSCLLVGMGSPEAAPLCRPLAILGSRGVVPRPCHPPPRKLG